MEHLLPVSCHGAARDGFQRGQAAAQACQQRRLLGGSRRTLMLRVCRRLGGAQATGN